MKNHMLITSLLFAALSISSCGSGESDTSDSMDNDTVAVNKEPKSAYAQMCSGTSDVAVTIKGYKHQMSSDNFGFETGNFDVKQSNIEWSNDSNATITLKNYASGDLVGDRKDDQVDIVIELYARHGKKISPATYTHSASEMEYSSFTTMTTSKGKVYFNWMLGMNEQGSVKLDYIEGDQACGSFNLAVEKPDNGQIGTVRLTGNFKTE